jgi:hypothetical protein
LIWLPGSASSRVWSGDGSCRSRGRFQLYIDVDILHRSIAKGLVQGGSEFLGRQLTTFGLGFRNGSPDDGREIDIQAAVVGGDHDINYTVCAVVVTGIQRHNNFMAFHACNRRPRGSAGAIGDVTPQFNGMFGHPAVARCCQVVVDENGSAYHDAQNDGWAIGL